MANPQFAARPSVALNFEQMPSVAADAIAGATSPPPPRRRMSKYDRQLSGSLSKSDSRSHDGSSSMLPDFKSSRPTRGAADTTSRHADLNTTWTEMQNTLEEVELNADSGRSAFSADHAHALEDLRTAQIELAQAWARSEAEDENGHGTGANDLVDGQYSSGDGIGQTGIVGSKAEDPAKGRSRGQSTAHQRTKLELETENDIQLARKRREANDRYFERVNKGVVDVVKKLEIVAGKMKDVEDEAQDIWDERDSLDSDSVTS
ncbi:MAG: hypothetical protein M1828_007333 [Chrysothrix sp. TS-e1954]|nr:MAG: hypothetical protein M1828_007333 [Chrysothrix sp. TS-e1954]